MKVVISAYPTLEARMPRQARLDAPGLVHHVMARGIEDQKIFRDDKDREGFLTRLAEGLALS